MDKSNFTFFLSVAIIDLLMKMTDHLVVFLEVITMIIQCTMHFDY